MTRLVLLAPLMAAACAPRIVDLGENDASIAIDTAPEPPPDAGPDEDAALCPSLDELGVLANGDGCASSCDAKLGTATAVTTRADVVRAVTGRWATCGDAGWLAADGIELGLGCIAFRLRASDAGLVRGTTARDQGTYDVAKRDGVHATMHFQFGREPDFEVQAAAWKCPGHLRLEADAGSVDLGEALPASMETH